MRDVVRQVIEALEVGRELVMCQVVETRGSTPQKAGAIMVVSPDGGQIGTLGGGCVENEVKMKAIREIGAAEGANPGVGTAHSFLLDHDYAWADGLICGGKMVIVTQSIRGDGPLAYFRAVEQARERGEGFTEAVVVEPDREAGGGLGVGSRFLFDGAGRLLAGWPKQEAPGPLASRVPASGGRPRPSAVKGVAYLPSWPRVRLVIVGAGHVGQSVARLAAQADFDVWVVDDRRQYANPNRFPDARRILVGPIGEALPSLDVNENTYALIVTRGHGHDQEALYHLATTPAPYVGLIGSRRKIRLIFDGLRDQGVPDSALRRVAAPVGFDIGSQTVIEIAVSIVAELIARRNLGPKGLAPRPAGRYAGPTEGRSANEAPDECAAGVRP